VKIPLCEDIDVLSWLMHSDDDINNQALQGCGAPKVNDLAVWLRDKEEEYFKAGKLWKILGYGDLNIHSATKASISQYLRYALQALAKVPAGTQPEALSLEVMVRSAVSMVGDNEQEKAGCLEWLVELNGDEARMDQLNARGRSLVHLASGLALISFSSSHYCTRTAAPIEQLQRGARSYLQYDVTGYSGWEERTGFLKWYSYCQLSSPLTYISISYIAADVTNDRERVSKVLGQEGEKLEAFHSLYSFTYHIRVTTN
jgi:hypothetical protein